MHMAIASLFKKAYWSLAIVGALYFCFLLSLLNGFIQRQALYAHNVATAWWQDPEKPEQFGFLQNQVQAFKIETPDSESLYAWHVLPLGVYIKHEQVFRKAPPGLAADVTKTKAFEQLTRDKDSRLAINFHGNAGTVAQGWRTDTYRALSSGASDKIHVLAVDYRGFGYSTGSPNEAGLVTDGLAIVDWALHVAQIPPERIVIVGQSLGTAVAVAAAEQLYLRGIEVAGIVLVAGFSDIPTLMLTYTIGGVVPILSPLRPYPFLQQWFAKCIQETWLTSTRLARLIRTATNINLSLIHSRNDYDIPWTHSNTLFFSAANATSEEGLTSKQIDKLKFHQDLGDAGWINTWKAGGKQGGTKLIRQEIVNYGGK